MSSQLRASRIFLLVIGLCLGGVNSASGACRPGSLFSENAVLQQGVPLPIWGTTDREEKIIVRFAGQEVATLPEAGKWRVDLTPLTAGGPLSLTIQQGDVTLEIKSVLVGDVWLCAGEANMQWAVNQSAGARDAIAASANDRLRLCTVPRRGAAGRQSEISGNWSACRPETVAGFSAVGYYFGRDLEKALAVPVGLISANVGSTTAERWISQEALESVPELKDMSRPQGAGDLYNAMIAPLAPFPIRGVLWYQGESNVDRANQYRRLLPALIQNWRSTWNREELPFLIVQLAPYMPIATEPGDSQWAELRDAQLFVSRSVPKTGLVAITDLGEERDIRPPKKVAVGARLALTARALAYGAQLEFSGPVYDKMTIDGARIRLEFQHRGSGLLAKDGELKGFTIAGEDRKFQNAVAKIEGDQIIVSSEQVPAPVAVRYGWANYPVGNLWNREDLPASPFRTDEFPLTTAGNK